MHSALRRHIDLPHQHLCNAAFRRFNQTVRSHLADFINFHAMTPNRRGIEKSSEIRFPRKMGSGVIRAELIGGARLLRWTGGGILVEIRARANSVTISSMRTYNNISIRCFVYFKCHRRKRFPKLTYLERC